MRSYFKFVLGFAMAGILFCPNVANAERLRISPDDLRLRVAVSEQLSASVRRELKDLARSEPLPLEGGLIQSELLFKERVESEKWTEQRKILSQYYFLVARLEQSQEFSDEFLRRSVRLREGQDLADDYLDELNRLIARAVFTSAPEPSVTLKQDFPLKEVYRDEERGMLLLHSFPNPDLQMGRSNLQTLRAIVKEDRDRIEQRLKTLADSERAFLAEISVIGQALIDMRPQVTQWVNPPGEGLPFSL